MQNKCNICPRKCGVDRKISLGVCKAGEAAEIAHVMLHKFEEPFISGKNGSGAVFFAHCPLKCVYCQNYIISRGLKSFKQYSVNELKDVFLSLQNQGAHNLNLVSPTHYTPSIINAVSIAKAEGLKIPVVWNTSGYENTETIEMLKNTVDIFLTDFKYFDNSLGEKYSGVKDYFEASDKALRQMFTQVGEPQFLSDGLMKKGVVVRHLVLPPHTSDSKKVLKYLFDTFGDKIFISIMNQFTVTAAIDASRFPVLTKPLSEEDYNEIIDYAVDLGITNALIQEGGTSDESFIPPF